MADTLYLETGIATVKITKHLGIDVDFPKKQTCCGQPGYNGGYWNEARWVANTLLNVSGMAHIKGGLFKRGSSQRVQHIAEVLAQEIGS